MIGTDETDAKTHSRTAVTIFVPLLGVVTAGRETGDEGSSCRSEPGVRIRLQELGQCSPCDDRASALVSGRCGGDDVVIGRNELGRVVRAVVGARSEPL